MVTSVKHSFVSAKSDGPDTSLVQASHWNGEHVVSIPHADLTGLGSDDHTQYQKESERGAASGYAPLDSGVLVPIAYLPTGTSGTTVALGNHGHAHSALTGIGADDHHARSHDHSAAGDGTALTPATFTVPGGGKFSAGASFPGSPASGDRCWRTDLGMEFYFDGTRWLGPARDFTVPWNPGVAWGSLAADNYPLLGVIPYGPHASLLLTGATIHMEVLTTNDATKYWTGSLDVDILGTALGGTFNTSAIAPSASTTFVLTISSVAVKASGHVRCYLHTTKTSTPGDLNVSMVVHYRPIAT